jgi:prevent-host-death family protein
MNRANLADAKVHLGELIEQAASEETVCITRRSKPLARLTAVHAPRRPVALGTLQALTEFMPVQTETTGDFVREMRDSDRY